MNLDKLQNEQVNLSGMLLDLNESIEQTEQAVVESFTTTTDTDKLSDKLAKLKAKQVSLVKAIESNEQAIQDEQQRIANQQHQLVIDERKNHVKKALESLEKATKLQEQLSSELEIFTKHSAASLADSSEFSNQPRALVGRLAQSFNLFGAVNMAHSMPLLTTADAERIQSRIK